MGHWTLTSAVCAVGRLDEHDGDLVVVGDLTGGQLGNLTHRDLAPCQWDSWPVGSRHSWLAPYVGVLVGLVIASLIACVLHEVPQDSGKPCSD
jgi:hypothetical protein